MQVYAGYCATTAQLDCIESLAYKLTEAGIRKARETRPRAYNRAKSVDAVAVSSSLEQHSRCEGGEFCEI